MSVVINQPQNYFSIAYDAIATFLGDANIACLLQRIHYQCQNDQRGYQFQDGVKRIYNTYQDYVNDFKWLSVKRVGSFIRHLESIGWLITDKLAHLRKYVGFVGITPHFRADDQTKWYALDYQQIYEDTGVDLLTAAPYNNDSQKTSKGRRRANIPNPDVATSTNGSQQCPEAGFSSIYQEFPISTQNGSNGEKENYATNGQNQPIRQQSDKPNTCTEKSKDSSTSPQSSHEANIPGACSQSSNNRNNEQFQDHTKVLNYPNSGQQERDLYMWEDSLNRPNGPFLEYWAKHHYVPQGGRWATGARGFAYSEFYNNPARTDVLYQDFMEYYNTIAQNANQQQNQGIKPIFPSFMAPKPEVTQENKEQLAKNVATIAARGAGIALPNQPGGSLQHISFSEAASLAQIKPLPQLQKPTLPGEDQKPFEKILEELAAAQKAWREGRRETVESWVNRTPGVMMTLDGPMLVEAPKQTPASTPSLNQTPASVDEEVEGEEPSILLETMQKLWGNLIALGKLILSDEISEEQLQAACSNFTPEQIEYIKNAAKKVWKPSNKGRHSICSYHGQKVKILGTGASFVILPDNSNKELVVSPKELEPWLPI